MIVQISNELVQEAKNYSHLSRSFTSNAHDFHEGGLSAKERKMFEGKLGEKGIKQYLINNKIDFQEDKSPFTDADEYDFIIKSKKKEFLVDVKTRTQTFHTRTLEMVKQLQTKKIDIYISVKLEKIQSNYSINILGWCSKKDFLKVNRIENNGYLNNYVMFDNELRKIQTLSNYL